MSRIVLTGGPGAGKTSIIDLLSEKGFNIIPEPARTLIEDYEKILLIYIQKFQKKTVYYFK
jgi:predicted ATPase